MRGLGHTAVKRGKRVAVHLMAGGYFVAKFKSKTVRHIEFFDHAAIPIRELRTISIYKG